jgi:large subunit ribosomal protein L31
MKQGIHPDYRLVVFQDSSKGKQFLNRSTIRTNKTVKWEDGNEYPLVTLDVTSASHPFYTGEQRIVDTAGQVDRFMKRLQATQNQQAADARRREERVKPAPKKPSLLQEIYGDEEQA